MRMLMIATTAALTLGAMPAVAQSSEGEAPATPAAPQSRPMEQPRGMPGIYVTPVPQRKAPAAGTGEAGTERAPQADHGGGCQYVPRKLDLIV